MTLRCAVVIAALSLIACDSGTPDSSRVTVGPYGGFVRFDGATIDIPPGALSGGAEIWIEAVSVPSGHRAAGNTAFRFHPEGLRFAVPATVRFDVAATEHDATVFWSRADSAAVEPVATRIQGAHAVALIDHFSIGFAGWPLIDEADGGGTGRDDAGGGDAAAPEDGGGPGPDAGVSGVTCTVRYRNADCTPTDPELFENVPFYWAATDLSSEGALSYVGSPLYAFRVLYNTTEAPRFYADNPMATAYRIGDPIVPNLSRSGLILTTDFTVARHGSACTETPPFAPLVQVECSGSTILEPPFCTAPTAEPSTVPPLSCTVRRRDAACVETTTTEVPRFWAVPATDGPEDELQTDSPGLVELSGAPAPRRFYREATCDSYAPDLRGPTAIHRDGSWIYIARAIGGIGSGRCNDSLGTPHPTLIVQCVGQAPLSAPP